MLILKATRKVLALFPKPAVAELAPAVSDTALGDWYVNRIVVERQRFCCL